MGYADLRSDRGAEILAQRSDVISFVATCLPLDAERAPLTIELLLAAQRLTGDVVQTVKALLGVPRPATMHPAIQPMIATPLARGLPFRPRDAGLHVRPRSCPPFAGGPDTRESKLTSGVPPRAWHRTAPSLGFTTPPTAAAGAVLGRQVGRHLLARLAAAPAGGC